MSADKVASAGRVEASNRIRERVALGAGDVRKSMVKTGLTGRGKGKERGGKRKWRGRKEMAMMGGNLKKTQSECLHQRCEFSRCSDRRIHIIRSI